MGNPGIHRTSVYARVVLGSFISCLILSFVVFLLLLLPRRPAPLWRVGGGQKGSLVPFWAGGDDFVGHANLTICSPGFDATYSLGGYVFQRPGGGARWYILQFRLSCLLWCDAVWCGLES